MSLNSGAQVNSPAYMTSLYTEILIFQGIIMFTACASFSHKNCILTAEDLRHVPFEVHLLMTMQGM